MRAKLIRRCLWPARPPARALHVLMAMLTLAGCTVGPEFVRPVAQTPMHW